MDIFISIEFRCFTMFYTRRSVDVSSCFVLTCVFVCVLRVFVCLHFRMFLCVLCVVCHCEFFLLNSKVVRLNVFFLSTENKTQNPNYPLNSF